MPINRLLKGYMKFKEGVYELHEKEFVELISEGQKPSTLFISCSDSRVVPELITQCDPGTLFHQRQVGNFVPAYSEEPEGMHTSTLASVEFAIHSLKVKDIIICGHSKCGACAGLYEDFDSKPEFKYLNAWINQSPKLKEFVNEQKNSGLDQDYLGEVTEKVSLLCQLENLLSYPIIKEKTENKELFLHVWYYEIASGNIEYYNSESLDFVSLDELIKEND